MKIDHETKCVTIEEDDVIHRIGDVIDPGPNSPGFDPDAEVVVVPPGDDGILKLVFLESGEIVSIQLDPID